MCAFLLGGARVAADPNYMWLLAPTCTPTSPDPRYARGQGYITRSCAPAGGRARAMLLESATVKSSASQPSAAMRGNSHNSPEGAETPRDREGWDYDMVGHLVQTRTPEVDVYSSMPASDTDTDWHLERQASKQSISTKLFYDALGNLVQKIEAAGIAEQERVTTFEYDWVGRQTRINVDTRAKAHTNSGSYSGDPYQTGAVTNRAIFEGTAITYTLIRYNAFGEAVMSSTYLNTTSFNQYKVYDQRGQIAYELEGAQYQQNVTRYQRDAFGNVTSLTRYGDPVEKLTSWASSSYSLANENPNEIAKGVANRTRTTADRTIETRYDLLGRNISEREDQALMYDQTSLTGNYLLTGRRTTSREYNGFGELIAQSHYAADDNGTRLTAAATTRFYYNVAGQKIADLNLINEQAGYVTSYGYDSAGNLQDKIEHYGLVDNSAPAADDDVIARWTATTIMVPTISSPAEIKPSEQTKARQLEEYNNRRQWHYTYDQNNRQIAISRIHVLGSSLDNNGQANWLNDITTSTKYDAQGNVIAQTDELGGVTFSHYDQLGRVNAIAKSTATDPSTIALSTLRLDAYGNTILRIDSASGATSTSSFSAKSVDPTRDRITAMNYNRLGHMLEMIDAEGHKTSYSYDSVGHLARQWSTYSDVDANGNLGGVKHTSFSTKFYDIYGREEVEITPNNTYIDDHGQFGQYGVKTIKSAYNAFGERTLRYINFESYVVEQNKYDNTGHIWLTNSGDGVDRITLYNAQGQETAQFRSPNANMSSWNLDDISTGYISSLRAQKDLQQALTLGNLQMTTTRYDILGHVIDSARPVQQPSLQFLRQDSSGKWQTISAAQDATQEGRHLLVIATPAEAGRGISARYRSSASAAWTYATDLLETLDGYRVLDIAKLPSGDIEWQVVAPTQSDANATPVLDPQNEATIEVFNSGILHVDANLTHKNISYLYQLLFNRAPDVSGINYWVGQINQGKSLAAVAQEIIASAEGSALPADNLQFIKSLLANVGRTGAATDIGYSAEVARWASNLQTATRGQVVVNVINDIVAANTIDNNAVNGASLNPRQLSKLNLQHHAEAVARYYGTWHGYQTATANAIYSKAGTDPAQALIDADSFGYADDLQFKLAPPFIMIFGRVPNASEINYWRTQLMPVPQGLGLTVAQLAANMLASPEVQAYAQANNIPQPMSMGEIIKHTYNVCFHRTLTSGDFNYWLGRFPGGSGDNSAVGGEFIVTLAAGLESYTGYDSAALIDKAYLKQMIAQTASPTTSSPNVQVSLLAKDSAPTLEVDRWGNVLAATNLRNPAWKTFYRYNDQNQLVAQFSAAVETWEYDAVNLTGVQKFAATTQFTAYDAQGHVTATIDARGSKNSLRYDGNGVLLSESHADGGAISYVNNIFGQRVQSTQKWDATRNVVTHYGYDRNGNLTDSWLDNQTIYRTLAEARGIEEFKNASAHQAFRYDELGRRIAQLSYAEVAGKVQDISVTTRVKFDLSGNLISTMSEAGVELKTSYDRFNHKNAQFDGQIKMTWKNDAYGHVIEHQDLGGHVTYSSYDGLGRLTLEARATGERRAYSYDNFNRLTQQIDQEHGNARVSQYTYDIAGNRVSEKVLLTNFTAASDGKAASTETRVIQDQRMTYNQLGWLQTVKSNVATANYNLRYQYDANGNRVKMYNEYRISEQADLTKNNVIDDTYVYDAMNRQKVLNSRTVLWVWQDEKGGTVPNGKTEPNALAPIVPESGSGQVAVNVIPAGWYNHGSQIKENVNYDWAGNRVTLGHEKTGVPTEAMLTNYVVDDQGRVTHAMQRGEEVETIKYDAAGHAVEVTSRSPNKNADMSDKPESQKDLGSTTTNWYVNGRLRIAHSITLKDPKQENITFYYKEGDAMNQSSSYDAAGNLVKYWQWQTNSEKLEQKINYDAAGLFDTYNETSSVTLFKSQRTNQIETSTKTKTYDGFGYITRIKAESTDASAENSADIINSHTMWNDAAGRALMVRTDGQNPYLDAPLSNLIVDGHSLGSSDRTTESFTTFFDPMTSGAQASSSAMTYTVQSNQETLRSIATALWGDGALWYLIGDANNLRLDSVLKAGTVLSIPAKVSSTHNDYQTYRQYSLDKLIGPDYVSPLPAQNPGGCGATGQFIMMVISIAEIAFLQPYMLNLVTTGSFTAAAATTATTATVGAAATTGTVVAASTATATLGQTIVAGALTGMAASGLSQAAGIVMGMQNGFDWKGIAMGGVAGGVGAGLGFAANSPASGALTKAVLGQPIASAIIGNVLTQGIGVMTGLQHSFEWRSVAISGVAAGVGQLVGYGLDQTGIFEKNNQTAQFAKNIITGLAQGATSAAMRKGPFDFGAVARDVFGNIIGNAIGESLLPTAMRLQKVAPVELDYDRNALAQIPDVQIASAPKTNASGIRFTGLEDSSSNQSPAERLQALITPYGAPPADSPLKYEYVDPREPNYLSAGPYGNPAPRETCVYGPIIVCTIFEVKTPPPALDGAPPANSSQSTGSIFTDIKDKVMSYFGGSSPDQTPPANAAPSTTKKPETWGDRVMNEAAAADYAKKYSDEAWAKWKIENTPTKFLPMSPEDRMLGVLPGQTIEPRDRKGLHFSLDLGECGGEKWDG